MPPVAQPPARVNELDALRGLAAVAVMLFHYTSRIQEIYSMGDKPLVSFDQLYFGVNLFFIISGYVIFMTLNKTKQPMDFVVSRFSRLFPAYWVAIALTYLVTRLLGLPGRLVSGSDAFFNLAMMHNLFSVPHVDPVYWTLEVELLFYLGMFTLYRTGLLGQVHKVLGFMVGLHLLNFLLNETASISLPWLLARLLILKHLPWFAIGVSLFLYVQPRDGSDRQKSLLLVLAAALVIAITESSLPTGLLALALAALVWAASSRRTPWLAQPVFVWLGAISYPLYLVHQNIGWSLQLRLRDVGVPIDVGVLCAVAFSLLLATGVARLVEQPAMGWIRQRYRLANAAR
jgi:peptidoglycan/LPS O-acetylase OafA/YrhL